MSEASEASSSSDPLEAFENYVEQHERQREEVEKLLHESELIYREIDEEEQETELAEDQEALREIQGNREVDLRDYDDFYNEEIVTQGAERLQEEQDTAGVLNQDTDMPGGSGHEWAPEADNGAQTREESEEEYDGGVEAAEPGASQQHTVGTRGEQGGEEIAPRGAAPQCARAEQPEQEEPTGSPAISPAEIFQLQIASRKRRSFRQCVRLQFDAPRDKFRQKSAWLAQQQRSREAGYQELQQYIREREQQFRSMVSGLEEPAPQQSRPPRLPFLLTSNCLGFIAENPARDLCAGVLQLRLFSCDLGQYDFTAFRWLVVLEVEDCMAEQLRIENASLVELAVSGSILGSMYIICVAMNQLKVSASRLRELELRAPLAQILRFEQCDFAATLDIEAYEYIQQFTCFQSGVTVAKLREQFLYLEQLVLSSKERIDFVEFFSGSFFPSLKRLECTIDESQNGSLSETLAGMNINFPRLQTLLIEGFELRNSNITAAFEELQMFQRETVNHSEREQRLAIPFVYRYIEELSIKQFTPFPGRLFNQKCGSCDFEQLSEILLNMNIKLVDDSRNTEPYLKFKRLYFGYEHKQENADAEEEECEGISTNENIITEQMVTQIERCNELYERRFQFGDNQVVVSMKFMNRLQEHAALFLENYYKRHAAETFLRRLFLEHFEEFEKWKRIVMRLTSFEWERQYERNIQKAKEHLEELHNISEEALVLEQEEADLESKLNINASLRQSLQHILESIRWSSDTERAILRIEKFARHFHFEKHLEAKLISARQKINASVCIQNSFRAYLFNTNLQKLLLEQRTKLASEKKLQLVEESLDEFNFSNDEEQITLSNNGSERYDTEIDTDIHELLQESFAENYQENREKTDNKQKGTSPQEGTKQESKKASTPLILSSLSDENIGNEGQKREGINFTPLNEESKAAKIAEQEGWHFATEEAAEIWYEQWKTEKRRKYKVQLTAAQKYEKLLEKKQKE